MRSGIARSRWSGWPIAAGFALALAAGAPGANAVVEAHAVAEVSERPEAVWALLQDFPRWDQVFPSVASVTVERVDERHVRLRTRTSVAGRSVRYTLAATIDAGEGRIDCALDPREPSDVRSLASSWRVRAVPGGGTRIELTVRSESGLALPRFVERRFTERSTRQSVAALVSALDERRLTLAAAD